jgi:hypothetical protein
MRSVVNKRRAELAAEVAKAEAEFQAGDAVPRSARQLIDEIMAPEVKMKLGRKEF